MKLTSFLLAVATSIAVPATLAAKVPSPSTEQLLTQREKESWAAWQHQDRAFWQRHLSSDHVEIDGPNGPQDRNYVLNGVANRTCAVTSYDLADFRYRPLGADAGMLVYRATQEFVCGDRHIPNTGWVTSTYRRRNGQWENVLFEHLAIPPPKAGAPIKN